MISSADRGSDFLPRSLSKSYVCRDPARLGVGVNEGDLSLAINFPLLSS